MPIQADQIAPYAPAQTITTLIERYRERGLTTPITGDVLMKAGIKDSLTQRVLQSLKLLDLIDGDGNPTVAFAELKKAPQGEFQPRLAEIIRSAYAEIFKFTDPAKDPPQSVRDAFRGFSPDSQQERMVMLFLGLCEAAGIIETRQRTPKTVNTKPVTKRQSANGSERKAVASSSAGKRIQQQGDIPAPIMGLLQSLPIDGWTQEKRDKFVKAFEYALDYSVPVRDEPNVDNDQDQ